MSKILDILREYTAPLEDNYGKTTYDAVIASIEIKILEAIEAEEKFIWRISWRKNGTKVSTLYGKNNTKPQMVEACRRIAETPAKRPVVLEKIVGVRDWQ